MTGRTVYEAQTIVHLDKTLLINHLNIYANWESRLKQTEKGRSLEPASTWLLDFGRLLSPYDPGTNPTIKDR